MHASSRLRGTVLLLGLVGCVPQAAPPAVPTPAGSPAEPAHADIARACAACHAFPPPHTFPKAAWASEVAKGYGFLAKSGLKLDPPDQAAVVRYFMARAPEALPMLEPSVGVTSPLKFDRSALGSPGRPAAPAVASVRLVHLSDPSRPEILGCDMISGLVFAARPWVAGEPPRVLSTDVAHPAHAEVVDLDKDGISDILVADLGSPLPTDNLVGRVLWLRGQGNDRYETVTLLDKQGRVADVQAADFDGDGDLDLVAAAFGWHDAGSIVYLENRGTPARPSFVPTTLDRRHGAIHVPIADLDGDGRPDFVALLGQEHEAVVYFHNDGGGKFTPKTLYAADHPAFGSSGIQLVDIDGDKDLDVLMTNGDVFDTVQLQPFQGVQWLENRGLDRPFEPHVLASLYGAQRAKAADLDGDGDMDILAGAFLPEPIFDPLGKPRPAFDSLILLEQVRPGEFARHSLEVDAWHHPTLDLGDIDGDGRIDAVIGNFVNFGALGVSSASDAASGIDWVTILRNRGR